MIRNLCFLLLASLLSFAADDAVKTRSMKFDGPVEQAYNAVYKTVLTDYQLRNASAKLWTIRFLDASPDRAKFDLGVQVEPQGANASQIIVLVAPGKSAASDHDADAVAKSIFHDVERYKNAPMDAFVGSHGERDTDDAYEFLARGYDVATVYGAAIQVAQGMGTIERTSTAHDELLFRKTPEAGKSGNLICIVTLVDQGKEEVRSRMRFRGADGGKVYLSDSTETTAQDFFRAVRSALVPIKSNPADSPYQRE